MNHDTSDKETRMNRTSCCRVVGLSFVLAVALTGSVTAQQHQQHHPGGAQPSQGHPAGTAPEPSARPQMLEGLPDMLEQLQGIMENLQGMLEQLQSMQGRSGTRDRRGRMGMGGMMGRQGMGRMAQEEQDDEEEAPPRGMMGMGGMLGHHMERLAQQLELTNEQQAQVRTLLRNHAKEAIRLRADIGVLAVDVRQLLETDPVDLPKIKQLFQGIAAKEADLRYAHVTFMQEVNKLLTPEQQKQFRTIRGRMMGMSDMLGHGGMMGRGRREK
jgi:Spy/CpxP family protein refolding chaperone